MTPPDRRIVVIGNGMSGSRFVQELLATERRFDITVIGDEPGGAYNRILLSEVLAGRISSADIQLATCEWYAAQGVTLMDRVAAVRVDRAMRTVSLTDGGVVPYDVLIFATGSAPVVPPFRGLQQSDGTLLHGAVAFRTLGDCAAIEQLVSAATSATVVGGGLLGLEAARGLAGRGLSVRLLQREPWLMERQLDADAGRVLARTVRGMGVRISPEAAISEVGGQDRVRRVTLTDGRRFDTDVLVLSCGVRPRVELAREAGLRVEHGILVDDRLRTLDDPSILAIGECAQHRGRTYGLVAPAWEQARVAARALADPQSSAHYCGSVVVTRLKAAGIELATLGDSCAIEDTEDIEKIDDIGDSVDNSVGDDLDGELDRLLDGDRGDAGLGDPASPEIIRFVDPSRGIYQKLVVRDGRLVGAILLGDTRTVGTVIQLFDRGSPLPADRAGLLLPMRAGASAPAAASPMTLPGRATICQCNGVSKSAICSAWLEGARSVADVAARTRATTGCGTCRDAVGGIVTWLAETDTDARDTETAVPA
jgi:assimilatory nitrate reductase electron transfer subunit